MAKFSLVTVTKVRENGNIDGVWVQDHVGTLEEATDWARQTEKANGNRIDVAVVDQFSYVPDYSLKLNLERLDIKK